MVKHQIRGSGSVRTEPGGNIIARLACTRNKAGASRKVLMNRWKEVNHMKEFTLSELDALEVEMLPSREALGAYNFAGILASNSSTALNVLTIASLAASQANQAIIVSQ
jgi:hypothetical protein